MNLIEKLKLLEITEDQIDTYVRVHAKLRDSSPIVDGLLTDELYEELKQINARFITVRETDRVRLLSIEAQNKLMPKCKECGKAMVLFKVNISKGKANIFGWKSLLQCPYCLAEEYSLEPFEERQTLYLSLINNYIKTHRRK